MEFTQLGLRSELLRALASQGYTAATPIQAMAIPEVMQGHDLMASAQTGTGKTAAFLLPLLHRLAERARPQAGRGIRALVLTPTRELAAQVAEYADRWSKPLALQSTVIFGGVNINPQIARLSRRVDLLIATPGRLLDIQQRGSLDLSQVEILVLDEADRMLDMGFRPAMERILRSLPKQRQTLLFSATFSSDIVALATRFMHSPRRVAATPPNSTVESIAQEVIHVDQVRKRELLSYLIGDGNWRQVLVFTRTKHGANRLATQLEGDGISAAAIHGNKSQGARTRALADFKAGKVRALVATDIAARGIDIEQLPHVVNFDLPNVPEDYVHRIGRTGRAGRDGIAMSLVAPEEAPLLRDIRRLVKVEIPARAVVGFEPTGRPNPDAHSRPSRPSQPRRARSAAPRSGSDGPRSGPKSPSQRPGEARPQRRQRSDGQRRSGGFAR